MLSTTVLSLLFAPLAAAQYSPYNFRANFGSQPAPFTIDVDPKFIAETTTKVLLTRLPTEIKDVPPFSDGPTVQNATRVRDYWLRDYNWFAVQKDLNKYHHFTTTVRPISGVGYDHDVPLHFLHHRSNRSDAIPLLFMHGWPGNWLEVTKIIDGLTNPPNASLPAFHVVAPSTPGVGFSPPPEFDGMGPVTAGHAMRALMLQLGYDKFVMQGGDWGGIMLQAIASAYPDNVVSALSNFWPVQPTPADREAAANGTAPAGAAQYITTLDNFIYNASGYRLAHETSPLQVAFATGDSPIGHTMWNYDLMFPAITELDTIITWSMMYYIQGPYAGVRFYKVALREGLWAPDFLGFGNPPSIMNIKSPMAISEFVNDLWNPLPLEWAQRRGNVVVRYQHSRGGHYAATEVPDLLLGDVWTFFGNRTLSNTQAFF